jgi:hypothetical protein
MLTPLEGANVGRELLQESIRTLVRSGQSSGVVGTLLVTNVDRLSLDAQSELTGLMRLVELPLRIITTSSTQLPALASGAELAGAGVGAGLDAVGGFAGESATTGAGFDSGAADSPGCASSWPAPAGASITGGNATACSGCTPGGAAGASRSMV